MGANTGNYGGIYLSTNSGATWALTSALTNNCSAIAMSANGAIQVAGFIFAGSIFTSTNFGVTWISNAVPAEYWRGVAASADGTRLAVASSTHDGVIYVSTNTGIIWAKANVPDNDWNAIASSADGTGLVAVIKDSSLHGDIYTSTNSGATWISNSVPFPRVGWYAVSSSADGGKLAAVTVQGSPLGIYTLQSTPPPQLNLAPSSNNLAFSWTVPSTNFVLQQNSELRTANWTNVTNTPMLNLMNLQNQISLPLPAGNVFYRLKTP